MGVLKRVVKPKNKRAKRALEQREPKAIENTKTALFVRGVKCSDLTQNCMKDLCALKKPHSIAFNQKNDIRPFEDATKLEFFCKKEDSSLFMFGNHNKKRPHNLVLGRMYDHQLLDMVELGIEAFTPLAEFKTSKVAAGSKPCLLFLGEPFSDPANSEFQRVKSLLMDFFRGPEVTNVRLAGIEHVLQFTALPERRVLLRSYKVVLQKSGSRLPRVELEEIGPRLDWVVRRTHLASQDLLREACKQVANLRKVKKVKNVSEDVFGSTLGQIHVGSQKIGTIQTRKMKGLKETREEREEALKEKRAGEEADRRTAVEEVFGGTEEAEAQTVDMEE